MTTIRPPALAASLKKLGVTPSSLTTVTDAAKAALDAGGKKNDLAKSTARALLDLDVKSLAAVRALLGGAPEATVVVSGSGVGGAGAQRSDVEKRLTGAPEAARVLAIYRPKAKAAARPLERVLVHAARLHDELSGPSAQKMLEDPKVAEGVRKHLFMLEGLVRLYESRGPDKKMGKALEHIKELEDAIGAFGYASDVRAAAKDLKLPASARASLDHEVAKAQKILAAVLDDGWLPHKGRSDRLNTLVDTFTKIDFGSEKEDRAFVRKQLSAISDDIQHAKLDMTDLEGGVHELRRQLRWLPITMIALDGLVTLDEKSAGPLPAFEKLKNDPVAQSPFARLPTSTADKGHIEIPWTLFLGLSKAIGDLGKIKDAGQTLEGLARALGESGLSKKDAHETADRLLAHPGGLAQVYADAKALHADLVKSGLLDALTAALA